MLAGAGHGAAQAGAGELPEGRNSREQEVAWQCAMSWCGCCGCFIVALLLQLALPHSVFAQLACLSAAHTFCTALQPPPPPPTGAAYPGGSVSSSPQKPPLMAAPASQAGLPPRSAVGSRYALAGTYGSPQPAAAAAAPPSMLPRPGAWKPPTAVGGDPASFMPATAPEGQDRQPAATAAAAPYPAAAQYRGMGQPVAAAGGPQGLAAAGAPGMPPLRISAERRYSTDSQGSGLQPGMAFAPDPAADAHAASAAAAAYGAVAAPYGSDPSAGARYAGMVPPIPEQQQFAAPGGYMQPGQAAGPPSAPYAPGGFAPPPPMGPPVAFAPGQPTQYAGFSDVQL